MPLPEPFSFPDPQLSHPQGVFLAFCSCLVPPPGDVTPAWGLCGEEVDGETEQGPFSGTDNGERRAGALPRGHCLSCHTQLLVKELWETGPSTDHHATQTPMT